MAKRINSSLYAIATMTLLITWAVSARAQVIIIQPNQDDSCAISFDENFNQINIGHYVSKKKSWCGFPSKAACHLPEWDCQGAGLLFFASDTNVVADGPLHNCSGVFFENASNASLSNADIDGAFSGVSVYGGSNINLENLSFQGVPDQTLGRALDIQGAQDVKASGLSFEGAFDRVNIASSSDVRVSRSSFDLSNEAFTLINIFESSDVAVSQVRGNGGQGLMSSINSDGVTISRATVTLSADGFIPGVSVFDSSDVIVANSTIDRRAIAASSDCFNFNDSNDVTVYKNKCLDSETSSGSAMTITIVKNYLVANNLFDGVSNGIFSSSDGVIPDNGEISRNTINMTGAYGLFLSAVTEVDVIKNNVTNILGTGLAGTWYYDELTDGTPLVINFEKNKYSGFEFNGECNSLEMICP